MTAFHPISPLRALEIVEAAGIPDGRRIIADYAAAELLKSYAQVRETIEVGGGRSCVRGAAIPVEIWQRIIRDGVTDDVWPGGTVRLVGSDLIGGAPAVNITAIGFKLDDLQRMINQHRGHTKKRPSSAKAETSPTPDSDEDPTPAPVSARRRKAPDLSGLHAGALHLDVEQTKAALSIKHTTFYKLLKTGQLERAKGTIGTRITVASVRRYAGLDD